LDQLPAGHYGRLAVLPGLPRGARRMEAPRGGAGTHRGSGRSSRRGADTARGGSPAAVSAAPLRFGILYPRCPVRGAPGRVGMRFSKAGWLLLAGIGSLGVMSAFQHSWREYPGTEYNNYPIPPDYQEKTEWAFARLMYPNASHFAYNRFRRFRFNVDWTQGGRGVFWTTDYPRSDRHFSAALRRLTRIH